MKDDEQEQEEIMSGRDEGIESRIGSIDMTIAATQLFMPRMTVLQRPHSA